MGPHFCTPFSRRPHTDSLAAPAPAPIAFVGKGITFDSGGIASLKPFTLCGWISH